MTTIAQQLSETTTMLVDTLVGYTIEREYGSTTAPIAGARILALASLQFDLADAHQERGGQPEHLQSYAETVLRMLVKSGLAARRCQCRIIGNHERDGHEHIGACPRHYEADVPELGGVLLCGTCHVAMFRSAKG
jgi:hypothetical protein